MKHRVTVAAATTADDGSTMRVCAELALNLADVELIVNALADASSVVKLREAAALRVAGHNNEAEESVAAVLCAATLLNRWLVLQSELELELMAFDRPAGRVLA